MENGKLGIESRRWENSIWIPPQKIITIRIILFRIKVVFLPAKY
jgi:hypothetical protein